MNCAFCSDVIGPNDPVTWDEDIVYHRGCWAREIAVKGGQGRSAAEVCDDGAIGVFLIIGLLAILTVIVFFMAAG